MGRYRSRSRSYSPRRSRSKSRSWSPPRRKRYDDPRDRQRGERSSRFYGDRRSSAPSGLLVRNVALDARDRVYSTRDDCSEPRSRSLSPPDYDGRDDRSHRRSLSPHENGNFSRSRSHSYSPRS
ncbi:hypothetical protein EJ110_NYTH51058 [Nymphaea thermarum]|nr:hypothetical protein EJ110_NYTH51058 [Nymphaea thermarum]